MIKEINKFLDNNIGKIVTIFILIGPFLDLTTSLSNHFLKLDFNFGVILKMIFMTLLVFYSLRFIKKKQLFYLIGVFVYSIIYAVLILKYKTDGYFVYEIQYLIRAFFYPICLTCLTIIYKHNKINISPKVFSNILLFYLLCIILPLITNTGFNSYAYSKTGTIGWFYSANEIGGILSILLPFLILNLFNIKNTIIKIIVFSILVITYFSIGTKVPILSLLIIIMILLVKYIINLINNKKFKTIGLITLIIIFITSIGLIFIPKTSFYKNIVIHLEFLKVDEISDLGNIEIIDKFIFSDRLSFFENARINFMGAGIEQKLIGIGYTNNDGASEVLSKTIEIDYYEILFRHGIIGFVLFFIPFILITKDIVIKIFKLKKINYELLTYIISLILIAILALFSGHILVAPSVSILVIIIQNESLKKIEEAV